MYSGAIGCQSGGVLDRGDRRTTVSPSGDLRYPSIRWPKAIRSPRSEPVSGIGLICCRDNSERIVCAPGGNSVVSSHRASNKWKEKTTMTRLSVILLLSLATRARLCSREPSRSRND